MLIIGFEEDSLWNAFLSNRETFARHIFASTSARAYFYTRHISTADTLPCNRDFELSEYIAARRASRVLSNAALRLTISFIVILLPVNRRRVTRVVGTVISLHAMSRNVLARDSGRFRTFAAREEEGRGTEGEREGARGRETERNRERKGGGGREGDGLLDN